jgi:hypothetical protein
MQHKPFRDVDMLMFVRPVTRDRLAAQPLGLQLLVY